jgi:hypothetical protein
MPALPPKSLPVGCNRATRPAAGRILPAGAREHQQLLPPIFFQRVRGERSEEET